jgi:hypothetical protein
MKLKNLRLEEREIDRENGISYIVIMTTAEHSWFVGRSSRAVVLLITLVNCSVQICFLIALQFLENVGFLRRNTAQQYYCIHRYAWFLC